MYHSVKTHEDLPKELLMSIEHFFKHYKDLEEGKWVKIDGWEGPEVAHKEIMACVARYQEK
jgi:inorganic pyrophosphatase